VTPYQAARTAAAIFDRSATAKLVVSGPDAPAFLSNLSTNDIKALPLGGGCETYFLDHRAKTLFQAFAYHVQHDGQNAIWLDSTPGRNKELLAHLDRYLISEAVELRDVTDEYALFHLAGPTASDVLAKAVGSRIPPLAEFQHMLRTIAGTDCSIRRHNALGLPGFDIVCPVEKSDTVLKAVGATPAGADVYETLRIEAGMPEYGPDIDATRFVMELPTAARAVSYTKGCFIGQEPIVMARDRAGHVNRAFLGLKVLTGGPLAHGTKLMRDGQEVGVVTSSVDSPTAGPIAVGYIRRNHQEPGTKLDAGAQTVEVIGWPPVR
jgi:folate-binding protein YgfZ